MIFFGTVTKTISKENRNTPLLSVTFLESRKFPKHRRVPLWNPSVLWDKKFLTGNRDNPSPSFIHKIFGTRNFLKSGKFLYEHFCYCEAKQMRRKIVIHLLSSLTLLDTRKFLKKRRVPIRSSSVLWDKNISQQVVIIHASTLSTPSNLKFLSIPNLCKISNGSLTNLFGTVRWNNFDGSSWHILSYLSQFPILDFFWNTEGSLYEVLRSRGTTKFGGKTLILHIRTPPHSHKHFGYQKPSALHKKSTTKSFCLLREKTFEGKSW